MALGHRDGCAAERLHSTERSVIEAAPAFCGIDVQRLRVNSRAGPKLVNVVSAAVPPGPTRIVSLFDALVTVGGPVVGKYGVSGVDSACCAGALTPSRTHGH